VLAACSLGGAGHLHPLLPFLSAARGQGHEVLVVGPPAMRDMVDAAGYPFWPAGEPPETDVAPLREMLTTAPPAQAFVVASQELFGRLATAAMLPGMEQVCAEWRPDLVLREPCEYASAVVAPRHAIPTAQVAISVAEGEAASITAAAPALERHRRALAQELLATPYLSRLPRSLDPSPFPTTVRFREEVAPTGEMLPDWWGGSKAPLVYMSFGTVLGHMSVAATVYQVAVKAVEDREVRVLLTTGRAFDASDLGPIPANIHVEAWVEQSDVLAHVDLVVCHGGSGTTFGAMAAGIPVVIVPIFADQFENGRRVDRAGAGLMVEVGSKGAGGLRRVIGTEDASRIAHGIDTVLDDASYRRQAGHIAAEMASSPPVDVVLDSLLSGVGRGNRR